MIRIYFAALIGAAIFFAYITGVHVGNVRCDARVANANAQQIITDTQIVGKANETVMHTGVRDIRRILREQYTISE